MMNFVEYRRFTSKLPTLETERLRLEKLSKKHTDDMYEYASDGNVTEFLTWEPHSDRNATKEWIRNAGRMYRRGKYCDWALVLRENGKMIGTVGITSFDFKNNRAEIGYALSPRFRGRGYMTEAVKLLISYCFETLGVQRVEARFIKENICSRALAERCGMTFEGTEKDGILIGKYYRDIGICAVTKEHK